MRVYIISDSEDYADEFEYPIISFMTEEMRALIIMHILPVVTNEDFEQIDFGTNEYLDLSRDRVKDMIVNAIEITPEEYRLLKEHMRHIPCVDIADYTVERLWNDEHNEDTSREVKNIFRAAYTKQQKDLKDMIMPQMTQT